MPSLQSNIQGNVDTDCVLMMDINGVGLTGNQQLSVSSGLMLGMSLKQLRKSDMETIYTIYKDIDQIVQLGVDTPIRKAFIEAKFLVDRWGVATKKFFVSESTFNKLDFPDRSSIWGN